MVDPKAFGDLEEALAHPGRTRGALVAFLRGQDPAWPSRPLREGTWTPLMVAEHVALAESSTAQVPLGIREGKPQDLGPFRPKGRLGPEEVLGLPAQTRAFPLEEGSRVDPRHPATHPHPFLTAPNWLRATPHREAHRPKALEEASDGAPL